MSAEPDAVTAVTEPDPVAVVTQLRDLASDPLNRRAIVQDQGCVPGLVLFLDHPNPQVVYAALLAIRYLCECCANRGKLRGELGMMVSLKDVAHKSTTPGETKLLAAEVYELLQSAVSEAEAEDRNRDQTSSRKKHRFFLGASNKRAKTVVLQIEGLDDPSLRGLCEEVLLRIRGVISFTFQMSQKRCIVRIRSDLKAEALASAIASTQVMKAQQVVKGDHGEELLLPFADSSPLDVELNQDLPEYLPEEESPSLDPQRAVTRGGSEEGGASWIGAASNFLSRSFYW
ncbi:unnamed protein product [Knipowitschia caucasica]|uniref:Armadillo repeat-containing protein 1 n=1 Tax=Knipowitschia caucasica TaxID=637954 RepID=A0AAV2JSY4_KNICA